MRNLLLFIVVIGTLSFTLIDKVSKSTEKETLTAGKISPEFSFKNTDGKTIELNNFKGKYVYIDIWATWCEPSNEELPALEKIKKTYTKNIEFVSISVDYSKDVNKWKQMVNDKNLAGTHLITDKNWHSEFIKAYKIKTIPRFILIDPQGKIVDAYAPRPSDNQLKTIFKELDIQ